MIRPGIEPRSVVPLANTLPTSPMEGREHYLSKGKSKVFSFNTELTSLIGLVSLFNGISTFLGCLMLKPFSYTNSSGTT